MQVRKYDILLVSNNWLVRYNIYWHVYIFHSVLLANLSNTVERTEWFYLILIHQLHLTFSFFTWPCANENHFCLLEGQSLRDHLLSWRRRNFAIWILSLERKTNILVVRGTVQQWLRLFFVFVSHELEYKSVKIIKIWSEGSYNSWKYRKLSGLWSHQIFN